MGGLEQHRIVCCELDGDVYHGVAVENDGDDMVVLPVPFRISFDWSALPS